MSWTTLQHKLGDGGGQFGDTAPLEDIGGGGAGPFLVFENGVFIYPKQDAVGRVDMPTKLSRPVRLMLMMANFKAASNWTLTVMSSANTSDTPYPSGDEPDYNMDSVIVASETGEQYVNRSWNAGALETAVIIFPSQRLVLTTTAALEDAVVRFTFSRAFDTKV